MNAVHIHLLITHFPILGTLIGAFILLSGMVFNLPSTRKVAYVLFILCGITSFISSASGEQSAGLLKGNPTFDEALIEAHQKYAGTAFVWSAIIGAACIGSFWIEHKAKPYVRMMSLIILILALANFCLLSWVGYQGGKIRHDEIRIAQCAQKKGHFALLPSE